ncbi:MAG: type II toxin-antitoxin system PemK/MazF family toxin [Patescibacteria group bacterium]
MPKKGAIILVPFPFTDLSDAKVRPALVVFTSRTGEDMIVVFISSKKGPHIGVFDIIVSPTKQNGLKMQSIIRGAKIATLEKKIAIGELGMLEKVAMKQVTSTLRKVFGL